MSRAVDRVGAALYSSVRVPLRAALAGRAARRRRLVAKLRAERRAPIRLFDQAREEYLAATGGTRGGAGAS